MPQITPCRRGRAAGFTLIELMIVVAILGILAGLMTGAVGFVQNSAKRNECLNNLRQWGGAMSMYMDDHRSRTFPTYEADLKSSTAWFNVLPPYLEKSLNTSSFKDLSEAGRPIPHPGDGAKGLFICPLDSYEADASEANLYFSSYTMNTYTATIRDSQLKFPSAFVVMTETCDGRLAGATSGPGGNLRSDDGSLTAFRHNKTINLLFADGHASNFPQSDVWKDGMAAGENLGGIQWNPANDL